MDNPCFDGERAVGGKGLAVYTIEGGGGTTADNRRNLRRSVRGTAPPPAPCLHKEWGGWSLDLVPRQTGRLASLVAALLLATLITIAATAALVYTLRTVHKNYQPDPVSAESWSSELLVRGKFRVKNEPFKPVYLNHTSWEYKNLSRELNKELDSLFRGGKNVLSSDFRRVYVTGLLPNLTVKCSLVLKARGSLTAGNIGWTFLNGLNHTHGHRWLGKFIIDITSISFSAKTEEFSWSQWSDWSECAVVDPRRPLVMYRKRNRVCLSLEGLKLNEPGPCISISKSTGDFELEKCSVPGVVQPELIRTEQQTKLLIPSSDHVATNNISTTAKLLPISEATTTMPTTTTTPTPPPTTTKSSGPKPCLNCEKGEVCVALENDPVPICRLAKEIGDPTGCGGLCTTPSEVCTRLTDTAFRCMDDSKCHHDEWQCGNSLCIPLIKRCDGHFNCYDHTDESDCECDLKTHFRCGTNTSCLPKSKMCDRVVDCWNAADESNCTIACLNSTQFTCNNSQCIPNKNFCDGYMDCDDHSDEPFGCGGVCKNHEWRCKNGRCIIKKEVCNGLDDCGDNSDEKKCGNRKSS